MIIYDPQKSIPIIPAHAIEEFGVAQDLRGDFVCHKNTWYWLTQSATYTDQIIHSYAIQAMFIEIEAPEISDYPKGFPNYWLNQLFSGTISANYQVRALANVYIRLVEAALVEYQLGTERLREFWDTHDAFNLDAMNRSVVHFETCVSNMHRAVKCYGRLRSHKGKDPLSLALNTEKHDFVTGFVADQLRLMSNEIHHIEELVFKGKLQEGQPIALKPDGPERVHPSDPKQTIKSIDRIVIGERELLFKDLAKWLVEMGRYAQRIADFVPENVEG